MGNASEKAVANLKLGGRTLQPNEYLAAVEGAITNNVVGILDRLGVTLADKFAQYAPVSSGKLQSSIKFIGVKSRGTGYRLEINLGVDYADYIDKGVRGIQNKRKTYPNKDGKYYQFKTYGMPPEALKELEGWAKRKNIELDAQSKIDRSEGRVSKIKLITSPASRLAYYIKKYGIEGSNFQQKSIDEVKPKYDIELAEVGYNSLILKVKKK